jgi:hypothetical protein
VDEFTFHQASMHVNPKWILLDKQSTTNIFCNTDLLANIRDAGKIINIHCNAGTLRASTIGFVCFSNNAIAKTLSLSQLKERYPVK